MKQLSLSGIDGTMSRPQSSSSGTATQEKAQAGGTRFKWKETVGKPEVSVQHVRDWSREESLLD